MNLGDNVKVEKQSCVANMSYMQLQSFDQVELRGEEGELKMLFVCSRDLLFTSREYSHHMTRHEHRTMHNSIFITSQLLLVHVSKTSPSCSSCRNYAWVDYTQQIVRILCISVCVDKNIQVGIM